MTTRFLRFVALTLTVGAASASLAAACTRAAPDPAAETPALPAPAPPAARLPGPTSPAQPSPLAGKALVKVNGVAITEEDVRLALRLRSSQEPIPPEKQPAVVESLIRDELVAQRAAALGMDQNESYLAEKAKMDAQIQAMRRRVLGDLYFKDQVESKIAIDDATVQRYFDTHKERLGMELHILQILVRRDAEAFAAVEKLKAGKSFAEVAREGFATVPDEKAPPWDLGWLKWRQVPEAWREVVYALQPGEHSGVIAGPRGRYWVIQLVDRRSNRPVSLDEVRSQITDELRGQQVEAARAALDVEIRRGARIER